MTSTLTPAKRPVAAPAAGWVGVVLALLLIAAGIVLGRDVLIGTGAIDGAQWLPSAVAWLDGLTAEQWMLPAGIGAVVLGIVLLIAALKPRRRTHRPTSIDGVWMRKSDIVYLARRTAADRPGVDDAVATGSARKVKVRASAHAGADIAQVRADVADAVGSALATLADSPKIAVKIKTGATK